MGILSTFVDQDIPAGILLLDIAIIAFLFYRAFLLLNRTRALQLLFAVFLFIVLDVVSRYLKLSTVSWLLSNISTYLVLGLIVLMQPELRRAASTLGVFRMSNKHTLDDLSLSEVLKAAKNMASKRIGSTIIILRTMLPQDIIEKGVSLNAIISSELIEAMFSKESPLHDGAIMIEGRTILAASCFLPVSSSFVFKKTYGARHRSALGMSEETDSIAIVTSEETGRISIIQDGRMDTPTIKNLENKLKEIWKGK